VAFNIQKQLPLPNYRIINGLQQQQSTDTAQKRESFKFLLLYFKVTPP